jgi:predicted Zn-dependent protease
LEDAEKYLEQAKALTPDNPLAAMYEAEKLVVDGDIEGAAKILQEYLQRQPAYTPAWSRLYAVSKQLGTIDSFLASMSETVSATENVNLTVTLAKYQFTEEYFKETRETLDLLDSTTALPDLYWYLSARLHLQNNTWEEATTDYQSWQQNAPRLLQPWLFELSVYEKYQKPRQGLRRIDAAKRLFPDNTSLMIFESKLNVTAGNLSRAKRLVSSLRQKSGAESVVDAIEGEIAFKEGRYQDAQSSVEKYYAINPNEKNALLLAELYSQLNQQDIAVPFMEEHLTSRPEHLKVRSKLAQLYLTSDPQKAVQNYSALVEEYSSNIVYLNNLAWALSAINKAEEGLKFIDDAYRLASTNVDILDTYITLLLQLERKSEAQTLLNNARANGVAPEKIMPLINKVDAA